MAGAPMSQLGPKSEVAALRREVCFTTEGGLKSDRAPRLVRATSGRMLCNERALIR